jgi:hypothetical protein
MLQRILMFLLAFTLASACAARTDNWNVELVGKTPGMALGVHVSGGYVYVADLHGGLLILRSLVHSPDP